MSDWRRRLADWLLPKRHEEAVQALFCALLGRPADHETLVHYAAQAQREGLEAVARSLTQSTEFREHWCALRGYRLSADPALARFLTPEVVALSQRLEALVIPEPEFDEALARAYPEGNASVVGQEQYLLDHRRRFRELFAVLSALLGEGPAEVLEVGVSAFSRLYGTLLPQVRLTTADRPVPEDYPGFTRARALAVAGSVAHVEIDLTQMRLDAHRALQNHPGFDAVVFCEVLEHLDVHPLPLLQGLGGVLRPGGWLYCTTPNFFCRRHLEAMVRRENPQPLYPAGDGNWDAHHHHREYALGELLEWVSRAGLEVAAFWFSDCWEDPKTRAELVMRPDERGNIVVVGRRKA